MLPDWDMIVTVSIAGMAILCVLIACLAIFWP
jgi:hypothetical protein